MINPTRPHILLTESLTPPYQQNALDDPHLEIIFRPEIKNTSTLLNALQEFPFQGIICPLSLTITEEVFRCATHLKIVSNIAVGLDNIDLIAAQRFGVTVSNTPGVLTEATADLTWSLLLASARRLIEADTLARSGEWEGWGLNQLLGASVYGQTIGIVGLGAIGQAVGKRARGFSMRVLYHSRTRREDLEASEGWIYAPLDDLISQVDFLVLTAPATPETYHLIDRRRLNSLKTSAHIINIGRGTLIDEEALIDALSEGRLAGAALDVYEREPYIPDTLRALPTVTLTPHIGSATLLTRQRMCQRALSAVREALTSTH
jgi:glyoxylate reductase